MKTDDKNILGIVIESYDHDKTHRVVIVISSDYPRAYHFFFVPSRPEIEFGDTIQINPRNQVFYVYRDNSRLTFKINPEQFPGDLLWQLICEHLSGGAQ